MVIGADMAASSPAPPATLGQALERYVGPHLPTLLAGLGLLAYGFVESSSIAKWSGALALGYVALPVAGALLSGAR